MSEPAADAILIMEDDPDVRDAMERILMRVGPIPTAATASDALTISRAEPAVRLVVADLSSAGSTFVADLTKQRCDIGLVYVSGMIRAAAEHRGLLRSADALVVKPFTTDQLRAAVAGALVAGREDHADGRTGAG